MVFSWGNALKAHHFYWFPLSGLWYFALAAMCRFVKTGCVPLYIAMMHLSAVLAVKPDPFGPPWLFGMMTSWLTMYKQCFLNLAFIWVLFIWYLQCWFLASVVFLPLLLQMCFKLNPNFMNESDCVCVCVCVCVCPGGMSIFVGQQASSQ